MEKRSVSDGPAVCARSVHRVEATVHRQQLLTSGASGMNAATADRHNFRSYRIAFAAIALAILAVPLIAMQFTGEVAWTIGDFLVAAILLVALGGAIELAIRHLSGRVARAAGIALALAAFVVVWGMLATG